MRPWRSNPKVNSNCSGKVYSDTTCLAIIGSSVYREKHYGAPHNSPHLPQMDIRTRELAEFCRYEDISLQDFLVMLKCPMGQKPIYSQRARGSAR